MANIFARVTRLEHVWRRSFSSDLITCRTGKKRTTGRQINERKAMTAKNLMSALEDSKYFFVLQYSDLRSHEWNDVRYNLRQHDINVKVFPTKLSNKILEETKFQGLGHLFKSSVVTCFSEKDNLRELIKTLRAFPKLELLGGTLENRLLAKRQIIEYSNLPPIETLRTELLMYLEEPIYKFMNVVDVVQKRLVFSLEQFVESKQENHL